MSCPKCRAKVGIMKHEVFLETGVIHYMRCVICGHWSQPYPSYNQEHKISQKQAKM
jgi:Zn ribbon nucleic-acid-binding protein